MTRWIKAVLPLAALLATAGGAEAQGVKASGGDRVYVGHGAVVPGTAVITSRPMWVSSTADSPPPVSGRTAPIGGLIETAARRINPFANPSRAWDVTFAPTPYRQPAPARAARPVFGAPPYFRSSPVVLPTVGAGVPDPSFVAIPGVNCPTCPN